MKISWRSAAEPEVGWDSRITCPRSGSGLDPEACLGCTQACPVGAAMTGRSSDFRDAEIEKGMLRGI